jgi:hypothetical protein
MTVLVVRVARGAHAADVRVRLWCLYAYASVRARVYVWHVCALRVCVCVLQVLCRLNSTAGFTWSPATTTTRWVGWAARSLSLSSLRSSLHVAQMKDVVACFLACVLAVHGGVLARS